MRLRTLHAALFAGVALTLTLCGAGATLRVVGDQLKAEIGSEMATVAGQVSNLLDRSIFNRWRDMRVLGMAAETVAPTPEARRVWLDAMRDTFPAYAWIGFADLDGKVTASTERILEGVSVADRTWFKAGIAAPFAGDVHKAVLLEHYLPAQRDGTPWRFLDVARPIYDRSGKVEGVVGAHLSWSWARDLTRSVIDPQEAKAPGTDVLVLDKDGSVILGPAELQGRPLPETSTTWKLAQGGDRFAVETWPNGASYLVGASRTVGLNDYPGMGWTVIVRQPVEIAFAPAQALARKILGGGLALALLAAALGTLIGRHISRPLARLTEAADALARDPSSTLSLPPEGTTELRRLASAFNSLGEAVAVRDRSLAKINQQLERRVEERTRELDAARQVAESASKAKTDFLATMSHEVRTPLNGVLGYADILLQDGALSADQRRAVERIHGAGNALLTVVNDILDFSKIEAGEIKLDTCPFALAPVVDEATSLVAIQAGAKGIGFRASIDGDVPPMVVGDANRLRQVLLNLLNNAVKFTRRGSVSLAISRQDTNESGYALRFAVTDTGIGIPKDKLDRLFHRFSQVDGSVAREFGGTGLGLAISRQLVELMGGDMSVTSEVDRGSTFAFTVRMPVAQGASSAAPRDAEEDVGGSLRILLAEDVPINQEIARAMIEAAGHTVDVVADGAEAVAAVQAQSYDLVLMDVQMPTMDGLSATRAIRALAHPAHAITIVAMTANVLPAEVERFYLAGMDDHIGKPFKRAELHARLAQWSSTLQAQAA